MSPSNLASVLMKLASAPDKSPVGEGKWQVTENGRGINDYTPARCLPNGSQICALGKGRGGSKQASWWGEGHNSLLYFLFVK